MHNLMCTGYMMTLNELHSAIICLIISGSVGGNTYANMIENMNDVYALLNLLGPTLSTPAYKFFQKILYMGLTHACTYNYYNLTKALLLHVRGGLERILLQSIEMSEAYIIDAFITHGAIINSTNRNEVISLLEKRHPAIRSHFYFVHGSLLIKPYGE